MCWLETWPTTASAGVNIYLFTFFTVFSFVPGVAGTRAHDANAPAPTLGIDALSCRHVALGALPAAVTQAASFGVLPVATTQHRAGCCEIKTRHRKLKPSSPPKLCKEERLRSKAHASCFPDVLFSTLA